MLVRRVLVAVVAGLLSMGFGCMDSPVATPPPAEPVPGPADAPAGAAPTVPAEDLKAVSDGNNAFATDLYKKLAEKEAGNLLLSPFSIRTALAMTYAGARGQTADEMRKVLHFGIPDDRLHPAVAGSARAMTPAGANPAYRLSVANALWGRTGEPFRPEFLTLNERVYGGGFRELDFGRDPEAARGVINRWVAGKTEERIPELLKKGDIRPDTVLVLTNAVYFKGEWERRFPAEGTREADFEPKPGERVRVPLMSVAGEFRHYAGPDARAVELPYRGGRLAMVVVLPVKRHGLADLERSMTAELLGKLVSSLTPQRGQVFLPRFKSKSRFELREPLIDLGMTRAFTFGADFTGITPRSAAIAKVVHAADIAVDEQGTEATAATAVVMKVSARGPFPFLFRANEPFLYLIRDRTTGEVVFLGRHTSHSTE